MPTIGHEAPLRSRRGVAACGADMARPQLAVCLSVQLPRRRERQMQRFKSPAQAQRFLSSHAMIYGYFRPQRHMMSADQYRRARANAFRVWRQETCVQIAA